MCPARFLRSAALAELLRESQQAASKAAGREDPHSPWRQARRLAAERDAFRARQFRAGSREKAVASPIHRAAFLLSIWTGSRPRHGASSRRTARCGPSSAAGGSRRRSSWRARSAMCSSTGAAICSPPSIRSISPAKGRAPRAGSRAPMPGTGHRAACRAGAGREGRAAAHHGGHEDGAHDPRARRRRAQDFRYAVGDQVAEGAELVDFEPYAGDARREARPGGGLNCPTRRPSCDPLRVRSVERIVESEPR